MPTEEACLSTRVIKCAGGGDPEVDYEQCRIKSAEAPCEDFEVEGVQYTGMSAIRECHLP